MQIIKKAERAVKRCQTKLSDKKLTDQSFKKSCDINNIVKHFSKTGVLPNSGKIAHYGDFSEAPTLMEAFNIAQNAQEMFYDLPSDIRKLIDNDPSKLEMWISDESNSELCYKYGLKEKPVVVSKTVSESDATLNVSAETTV